MAGNDVAMGNTAITWDTSRDSLVSPFECNFSLDQSQNPGLSAFPRSDLDYVRRLFSMLSWLQSLLVASAAEFDISAFLTAIRDARQLFVVYAMFVDEVPFEPLERKQSVEVLKRALKPAGLCAHARQTIPPEICIHIVHQAPTPHAARVHISACASHDRVCPQASQTWPAAAIV